MEGKDIVYVMKIITCGTVIIAIALGCYRYGYGIQGAIDGFEFALLPQNTTSVRE